jgi:hypothetical protein
MANPACTAASALAFAPAPSMTAHVKSHTLIPDSALNLRLDQSTWSTTAPPMTIAARRAGITDQRTGHEMPDDLLIQVATRIDDVLLKAIDNRASAEKKTRSAMMRDILAEAFGVTSSTAPAPVKKVLAPKAAYSFKINPTEAILDLHRRRYTPNQIAAITRQPYALVARALSDGAL